MDYFFATGSYFNVTVSYHAPANWLLAITSLMLNLILAVWQIYRIVKYRRHPLKDELWYTRDEQGSGTKPIDFVV
ncbi:DUF5692 family protein [Amphibacillus sp. Q70]|uniref:DUF5692 family protein n=1 Tax=Amphibacillus sp. Q70 TaxID=3453416 RepID=UPI003F84C17E